MIEQDKIKKIATNVVKSAVDELNESNFVMDEENMIMLISSLCSSLVFNLQKNLQFANRIKNKEFFAKVMWSTNKNVYKIAEASGVDSGDYSLHLNRLKK